MAVALRTLRPRLQSKINIVGGQVCVKLDFYRVLLSKETFFPAFRINR